MSLLNLCFSDPAVQKIDDRGKLVEDLLKIIKGGSSNDVQIVLEDGEIQANKDILIARSEYLASMLIKENFVEGKDNCVDMRQCDVNKMVMEKIIHFLFSGEMKLLDVPLLNLFKLMRISNMMLLPDIRNRVETATRVLLRENANGRADLFRLLLSSGIHQGVDISRTARRLTS